MVERLLAFIKDQELFRVDDKLLLAVSGGVDSMVLVHLFEKLDFEFSIAHCNFSLRDEESDQDAEFVSSYAESQSITLHSKTFETNKHAIEKNISTQMAARELRYDWFEELLTTHRFDYILTAHHLNDSLETSIFNLTKGTGLAGLRGMLPKKNSIVRPLLFSTRNEIESYAIENEVKWREDSSNVSVKYQRNFIRHEVVPQLRKINPTLEKTFVNTARRVIEAEEAIHTLIGQLKSQYVISKGNDIWVNKKALINALVTYELVRQFEFNYSQAIDIYDNQDGIGLIFSSENYQLNTDREHLIISPVERYYEEVEVTFDHREISLPHFALLFNTMHFEKEKLLRAGNASLDFSKLTFPLKIRKWREGDKFIPLGMKGKKKVSDFMIDAKIPLNLKSRVFVLLSGNEIVWIIGHRISEKYKITPVTKMMYNITIKDYDQSL